MKKKQIILYYFLAFIIPIAMIVTAMYFSKIQPFGNNLFLISDGNGQYVSFMTALYDKVKSGGSLMFSWKAGLGYDFWGVIAYYLASPLNALIFLFSRNNISIAISLIILLKISFASASMLTYCLLSPKMKKNSSKDKQIFALGIALAYALSNYVMAYYFNFMWLDCVLLLPLVILGVEKYICENKIALYWVTLSLAVITSFYIGYMLCIFVALYFVFFEWNNIKIFVKKSALFGVISILSVGIAAFLMLPTYNIISGIGDTNTVKVNGILFGNFLDVFNSQMMFTDTYQVEYDFYGANIYCGISILIVLMLYLFAKNISIHEKLRKLFLVAIVFLSFNVQVLNDFWHGFHLPNGFPNRFAFAYIFLILMLAYEVIDKIDTIKLRVIIFEMIVFILAIIAIMMYAKRFSYKSSYASIVVAILAFIVIVLHNCGSINKKQFYYSILIILMGEVIVNAYGTFYTVHKASSEEKLNYSENINVLNEKYNFKGLEYRSDFFNYYSGNFQPNIVVENDMNGIALFDSVDSNINNVMNLLMSLGLSGYVNQVAYSDSTPLLDAIFNIKYMLSQDSDLPTTYYDYVDKSDNIYLYSNNKTLGLGCMVSSDILSWELEQSKAMENQNEFVSKTTGVDNIFSLVGIIPDEVSLFLCEDRSFEDGIYRFSSLFDGIVNSLSFSFTIPEDMSLYLYITSNTENACDVYVDDEKRVSQVAILGNQHMIYVGDVKAGQKVKVVYYSEGDTSKEGEIGILPYSFSEQNFEEAYEKLSSSLLDVTEITDTYIKGEVDAKEDGVLFTSLSNNPGIEVFVDGEKTSVDEIGEALIGVSLTKGHHVVEFKYKVRGLKEGCIISCISLFALIILTIIMRNRRKANTLINENNNEEIKELLESICDDDNKIINSNDVDTGKKEEKMNDKDNSDSDKTDDIE